jgi:hypothetical protein
LTETGGIVPNWFENSSLGQVNFTFDGTVSNLNAVLLPEFEYLGVPEHIFDAILQTINDINTSPGVFKKYDLGTNSFD